MARPSVDFPDPLSPTSPRVSPRLMSRLTPSTALIQPPPRPVSRLGRTRKCTWRSRTATTVSPLIPLVTPPDSQVREARDTVILADIAQPRTLAPTALHNERATRCERTCVRHVDQAR